MAFNSPNKKLSRPQGKMYFASFASVLEVNVDEKDKILELKDKTVNN